MWEGKVEWLFIQIFLLVYYMNKSIISKSVWIMPAFRQ